MKSLQNDVTLYACAAAAASDWHKKQRRKTKDKTPYINHPLEVVNILVRYAGVTDAEVLAAAVLHDAVEDTYTTLELVKDLFGDKVAKYVEEVTDDTSLPTTDKKKAQVEHVKHASNNAKLIKMADKLHNLKDIQREVPDKWGSFRVQGYMVWCQHVLESCKGLCPKLEHELEKVFNGTFSIGDTTYHCIPKGIHKGAFLEQYYESLSK